MYRKINSFQFVTALFISLLFFPSITFGLLEAEVFPWGILISSLILFHQKKINSFFLVVLSVLLLNAFFFAIIRFSSLHVVEVIRSLLAYINGVLCMVVFYQASEKTTLKTIKLVKALFIFLLCLGFLQSTGLISFLDPVFKFLIPRASSESLSHVQRGVTLLATEPARAGVSLTFLYIVVRTAFFKKRKILYDFFFLIYLVLVIKSIMALAIYAVFILLTYRLKLIKILVIIGVAVVFADVYGGGRAFQMAEKIQAQENFSDAIMIVVDLGGPRLISIYSSWLYSLEYFFGGGIGHWRVSSVEALNMTGIDLSEINYFKFKGNSKAIPIRSSGYISNLVLDTGLIGVFTFFLFLFSILRRFWKNNTDSKNIILIFLFKILFIGSVGPPVAWIGAIISLKYINYKKRYENK